MCVGCDSVLPISLVIESYKSSVSSVAAMDKCQDTYGTGILPEEKKKKEANPEPQDQNRLEKLTSTERW